MKLICFGTHSREVRALSLAVVVLCGWALSLGAQVIPAPARDSTTARSLDTVKVRGRVDDLIGSAGSASEGRVGAAELRSRPITREGELLETIPGVIVTQHSGEGKANQYFVRGFNLDHGTDFQTSIEGMPLNMPTHGHGQGWTDLNFLIPELVDHLDYRLGVYHAELGNFGSAGGVELHLPSKLDRPFATIGSGQNGLARVAAGGSVRAGSGDLLVGGEAKSYDGPWERAEKIRKLSGIASYHFNRGASQYSALAMAYRNQWNSNDQIPERAVRSGDVNRFGQIDSTDGGESRRYSLSGSMRHIGASSVQDLQLFGIYSDLSLFSNFTYFLNDPVRGDQFNQVDRRIIIGGNAQHLQSVRAFGVDHQLKVGLQNRADIITGLGLYLTQAQVRFSTVREDRVSETATGVFVETESKWRPCFRSVLGLRADGYTFNVASDRPENSGFTRAGIMSPKASLVFTPWRQMELYLSGGTGFHSNDARGTTITVDPVTGDPAQQVDPLVRSRGAEIGMRAAFLPGLQSTLTFWALDLDSELLFVGDAGATEPSTMSRRRGVTWANFYRPVPQLSLDADVSFAEARLADVARTENHVPGALENVIAAGIAWNPVDRGPFGAVRLRHFGAYPLIEDNSVRAEASTLLSAEAGYLLFRDLRVRATVLNLLNARASDIQYFYASRLQGEAPEGAGDIHFHPVEPRQVRVSISYLF